jgi:long-chain acyl-CoA synthetase
MMSAGNLGDLIDPADRADRLAVIDLSRGRERKIDYGTYIARIDGVARMLSTRGLPSGSRVAIIGRNSFEYLAAYFGVMKAGLVAVCVNHKFPPDMIGYVLRDADIAHAFCDGDLAHLLGARTPYDNLEDLGTLTSGPHFNAVIPDAEDIAMVLYTSGSTGPPKGVPLTHFGQRWVVETRSAMASYGEHRMLIAAPLCHMNGLLMAKMAAFNGAEVVLLPEFTAASYVDAISRFGCTWITSVPTMLALVARERDRLATADLGSVRMAAMASAPVSLALFNEVRSLFPSALVVVNYGTTEAGAAIFGPHPQGLPRPPLSLGCALPGIGFRLVANSGAEANEGVLQVRTPAMTPGYLNRPEATAKLFTPDGWLVTGDVIRRDEEGFCYFVRRIDDMFVCGGENVYPAAVEEVLESHPGVEEASIVPVPDPLKGAKPVAFVVMRPGFQATEHDLKQYVLDHAPAFMHPRQIHFVDALPLSATNKVDRAALQHRAAQALKSTP